MKKEIRILKNIQNSHKLIKLFYLEIKSKKKLKSWISAARLETIPLSISGIIIGSFYSFFLQKFDIIIFTLALLTAISYQVLSNFANDYGDGIRGVDDDREGEKRMVASGLISAKQMKYGIIITAFLTLSIAVNLIYAAFGWEDFFNFLLFLVLGIISIIAALKYTIGKNAYGYSGIGDVFVFLFFGLLSFLGSNYLFTHELKWDLLLPASSIGLLSMAVLNLNNMRDIENDKKNKTSKKKKKKE